MKMKKVDVWLDDRRPAPEGWEHHTTIYAVMALLKRGEVRRLSLDHDLGTKKSGYDLCVWMAEQGKWPDEKPTVHSMNPVGAFAMRAVIDRYFGWDGGQDGAYDMERGLCACGRDSTHESGWCGECEH